MKRNPLKTLRNKADKLLQEYYRKQDLKCEVCGGEYSCKHHFFPKSKASALRYDERNLISLCAGCHLAHHTGDPRIHATVIAQRGQKWYNDLIKRKEQIVKTDIAYYKSILKSLK